jgi:poly(3-hydroxybutyrate) depolymerase
MMSRIQIGSRRGARVELHAAGALVAVSVLLSACASSEGDSTEDGGVGGAVSTGGVQATGGASSGGATAVGGAASGGSGAGGTMTGGSGPDAGGSPGAGGAGETGGGDGAGGRYGAGGGDGAGGEDGVGGGDGAGGEDGAGGSSSGTESAGCGTAKTLMNGRRTIQSGGQNREYILRVPDNYDSSQPYRLIVAYHWLSGNASQVANGGEGGSTDDPYYGLWDLAEDSTIFVAPEGLDAGWANTGDRDITLTDNILAEVEADLCIDKSRIFATGFSYGAGMSYAIACSRADVFRGVALYAGAQLSGCNGGNTPIAYFHAHGVNDSVLSIGGGRNLRDHYADVNGCTPMSPQDPAGNSGTHSCSSYEGCSDGHPVRWCAHGGDHNPTEKDSGQSKSWIPGEAWTFISQF